MKWQAARIATRWPVRLNTHDEHALVVPEADADEAEAWLRHCLRQVPPWLEGAPLDAEVTRAQRYGDY